VISNPKNIIETFRKGLAERYDLVLRENNILHEQLKAPVDLKTLRLPRGMGAVYVFSLSEQAQAPAGPNRVLKVGRVGPKSLARFRYQHYKPGSAQSTLAGSIKLSRILWEYIGVPLNTEDFGAWLIANTDRDHFFISPQSVKSRIIPQWVLEIYLRGILGPVFEG